MEALKLCEMEGKEVTDMMRYGPQIEKSKSTTAKAERHRRDKVLDGKKYYCKVCQHGFAFNSELQRHLQTEKHKKALLKKLGSGRKMRFYRYFGESIFCESANEFFRTYQ